MKRDDTRLKNLKLTCNSSHIQNKIGAIKALRGLSGIGLKDAKDLVETDGDWDFEMDSTLGDDDRNHEIKNLRDSGVKVTVGTRGKDRGEKRAKEDGFDP